VRDTPPRQPLGDVVSHINRTVDCRTEFYESMLGWTGTGIVIPKDITEQYGIKMEHYLEIFLLCVLREGTEIPIYPGKTVEFEIRKQIYE
jgi:hypothetical protein